MTGGYKYIHTGELEWEPWHPHFPGTLCKKLFDDEDNGATLRLAFIPAGFKPSEATRYHHGPVREGVYVMFGNTPFMEYDRPADTEGRLNDFRAGWLLDRPPRSIHGMCTDRATKLGCLLLEWTVSALEFNQIPFEGEFDSLGEDFNEPWARDSNALQWQPHPAVEGWKVKTLSPGGDDAVAGFHPVSLVFVPSGWQPENGSVRGEALEVRRWLYALWGDAPLRVYEGSDPEVGRPIALREGGYLEWRGDTVIGIEAGDGSEVGCVMLCVGHQLVG